MGNFVTENRRKIKRSPALLGHRALSCMRERNSATPAHHDGENSRWAATTANGRRTDLTPDRFARSELSFDVVGAAPAPGLETPACEEEKHARAPLMESRNAEHRSGWSFDVSGMVVLPAGRSNWPGLAILAALLLTDTIMLQPNSPQ